MSDFYVYLRILFFFQLFYAFGWFAAFGLAFAVVYGPYTATKHTWSEAENIIYGMTFRLVWAVALCWVIYACHNGYGSKNGFHCDCITPYFKQS